MQFACRTVQPVLESEELNVKKSFIRTTAVDGELTVTEQFIISGIFILCM